MIQWDKPDLVVAAIRRLVEEARAAAEAAAPGRPTRCAA
jgi:hypothetical protein